MTSIRTYGHNGKFARELTPQDVTGLPVRDAEALIAEIKPRLREIHQDPNGQLRDKSAAERIEFDQLIPLLDAAELHLKVTDTVRHRPRAVERAGSETRGGEPSRRAAAYEVPPGVAEDRDRALRMLDEYRADDVLSAAAADRADEVLRHRDPQGLTARYLTAVGDQCYGSAFGKMLADPQMAHLRFSAAEVDAVREATYAKAAAEARAALTTGATGFPLPLTVDPSIIRTGAGALNPVRDLASVAVIGTHDWVGVSSDGVTAGYVQEGVEATDASPTVAGPKISTQQGRAFCQFTIEAGQDWPTLQTELEGLVADARDVLDATMFLTGNGTNQPYGIFGGSATYSLTTTQRVQTNTVATYAAGDPWLLKAALPARFIPSATFAAAPATWDTTWQFVAAGSTTQARQFDDGRGGPFLGRPKVEWSTMGTGATTGTKLIVAGDFRTGYKIVDRLGMTAEIIPHMLGANRLPLGTRGLYVYWRTGAAVVAQNAFRYLEVK